MTSTVTDENWAHTHFVGFVMSRLKSSRMLCAFDA